MGIYHKSSPSQTKKNTFLIICSVLISIIVVSTISATFSTQLTHTAQTQWESFSQQFINSTTKFVGSQIGQEMRKDEKGNINILILGYGGEGHAGSYLTDSIIIASFNTQEKIASLISIPRDLIVNNQGRIVKINSIFATSYYKTKSFPDAAQTLVEKLGEITGITIPYYVLVDFDGFLSLVDKIGGMDVDIPQSIYDRSYPGPNGTYQIFSIQAGPQHLDAATALKYARSRHSSSDFSRSQRQQLIIQAIMEKLNDEGLSISRIQDIYNTYVQYIKTNISLDEMLGLLRYGREFPHLINFGYTYECNNSARKTMKAACLLYPVDQEQFNGMSGMLPVNASLGNVSNYKATQEFAQFVTKNLSSFKDNYTITIYNAIDPNYAKQFTYRNNIASNLAIKLKRYGFQVDTLDNANTQNLTGTLAFISGSGNYNNLLSGLASFLTIDSIQLNEATVDLSGQELTNHIDLYLGNTFLDAFGTKKFTTYLNLLDNAQ